MRVNFSPGTSTLHQCVIFNAFIFGGRFSSPLMRGAVWSGSEWRPREEQAIGTPSAVPPAFYVDGDPKVSSGSVLMLLLIELRVVACALRALVVGHPASLPLVFLWCNLRCSGRRGCGGARRPRTLRLWPPAAP